MAFVVISKYDLNLNPALRLACGVTDTKHVCCGPCMSKPIIATFDIKKGLRKAV